MIAKLGFHVIIWPVIYKDMCMSGNVKTVFIPSSQESKSGMFGKEKPTDEVDGAALARQIETVCNGLVGSGYQIIQVMPVTSGGNNYKNGVGYGYGYGYTSGVVIIANKGHE